MTNLHKRKQHIRRRKQIRLPGWDYRHAGAYFVTICTRNRAPSLGRVVKGRMILNDWGQLVVKFWREIPVHFDFVELDLFQCMPNHVHLILWILHQPIRDNNISDGKRQQHAVALQHIDPKTGLVGTQHAASVSVSTSPLEVKPKSLSAIIRSYKSAVSREINDLRDNNKPSIWQPRFHDRIIRNERELDAIRRYIKANPSNWREDHAWDHGLDGFLGSERRG